MSLGWYYGQFFLCNFFAFFLLLFFSRSLTYSQRNWNIFFCFTACFVCFFYPFLGACWLVWLPFMIMYIVGFHPLRGATGHDHVHCVFHPLRDATGHDHVHCRFSSATRRHRSWSCTLCVSSATRRHRSWSCTLCVSSATRRHLWIVITDSIFFVDQVAITGWLCFVSVTALPKPDTSENDLLLVSCFFFFCRRSRSLYILVFTCKYCEERLLILVE